MALTNTAMMAVRSSLLLLAWTSQFSVAQQFDGFPISYDFLGLGKACFDVINTTVACSSTLANAIHLNTGQICDLYLGEMRNQSKQPDKCSDCILGVYSIQLSSPLGYDDETVQQFSSIKSACGTAAATYTYTKTAYSTSPVTSQPATKTTTTTKAVSTTTSKAPTGPTTPPLSCERKYTVVQNDTCNSIALAQKTSTYNIITLNSLTIFCDDLPKPGAQICLPSACTPYKIIPGDTCTSIANKWSATVDELMAWNPIFSFSCSNVDKWWDFIICVGVGNGTSPTTIRTLTTKTATSTSTTPTVSIPPIVALKPPAPGSVSTCKKWRDSEDATDDEGTDFSPLNKCRFVTSDAEIDMADFLAWNPSLTSGVNCALDTRYSYCVAGPSAGITTTGTSKAPSSTTTKATSTSSAPKTTSSTSSTSKPSSVSSTSKPASSSSTKPATTSSSTKK
ncbi:hypothetical protein QBC47DRAFT_418232 [Echria macrotheca]|uniref:LysM domain-containing protein n=1 Tax=Echria macrotheca TaxID=438768 RepID=A0AAJ0B2H8_9PEZI|nr:hypothetical protein QBC47DRAFT_418232 [Echria macrotheca]